MLHTFKRPPLFFMIVGVFFAYYLAMKELRSSLRNDQQTINHEFYRFKGCSLALSACLKANNERDLNSRRYNTATTKLVDKKNK